MSQHRTVYDTIAETEKETAEGPLQLSTILLYRLWNQRGSFLNAQQTLHTSPPCLVRETNKTLGLEKNSTMHV